jgi:hypothetical protein
MHTVKEVDMLATKIDLLMKRLDDRVAKKEAMKSTVQAVDSHMTCEVCGEVKHSGNDYPKTHEEVSYINNGFRQGNNNGWNN